MGEEYKGQEFRGEKRLTPSEQYVLERSKIILPDTFLAEADDGRILAYADLVLADWNNCPPETFFDINGMPVNWLHLIPFGEQVFSTLFTQCRWTLMDFDYTDQGLNIRLDRVPKLDMSYKNLLEMYKGMKENAKHNILIHSAVYGLGTPRFQCFTEDTKVLTSKGPNKIINMQKGDMVYASDGGLHRVYATMSRPAMEDVYELGFEQSDIRLTGNHELLVVGKGWVPTKKIKMGDKCFHGKDLIPTEVKKISKQFYTGTVYDLSVEGVHSYTANGICCSNSSLGQFLKISLGCFMSDMKVITSKGLSKIVNIQNGDMVLSSDGKFHRVYDVMSRSVSESVYELGFKSKDIRLTGNHELLVAGKGWTPTERIKIGDRCFHGKSLEPVEVKHIDAQFYDGKVYDLSVEGTHSYNASGIICHNSAFSWNSPG